MDKFKHDDRVTISTECEDEIYHGISGTVIDIYPSSDGLVNRVCLDKSVNQACIFWFADHELIQQIPAS